MGRKLAHIEETVDRTTGEIKVIKKTFSVKTDGTEEFFMTFLSGMNAICELSRPSDIKVMALLCAKAEYNTGIAKLSTSDRREMEDRLDCSSQALSNSIRRLKDAKLVSGTKGNFEINPHYFWKGTTNERQRLLKDRQMDLLLKFRNDDGFDN